MNQKCKSLSLPFRAALRAFVIALALAGIATAAELEPWARLSKDGRQIIIEVEGITRFVAVSSAIFDAGAGTQRVGNAGSPMLGPVRQSEGVTPFGDAEISEATFGSDNSPFQYTLTLKRLKNLRAFTLQGVFHNRSEKDVRLHAFDLLDTNKGSGGSFEVPDSDAWLVTPLMEDTPAVSLTLAKKRLSEAALVYHKDGTGFLVGPVGPAEAYTNFQADGNRLIATVDMDKVLVRAGESRRSEEMIFAFEPIDTATSVWTRWVAATHGARLHRGPVYGWCSWYDRTTKIDEAHVMEVTKVIEENPDVFGKGIIQIDDGYQKMDGDWSGNEKFPQGMAAVARRIREAGCIPGVWFAPLMINPEHPWLKENPDAIQKNAQGIESFMNPNPFHPGGAKWVNPDHPATKMYLRKIISEARERGFGYIKIDFNGIGSQFVDPTKTRLQVFRELYTLYREAAGDEMYILSCLGQPTRGVIGFIDAARVGPDSHPAHFEKCLKSVLRFQIYDNVWWQNDPDVSYLASKLESRMLGPTPQGDGMWRTWHNITALVGGTAMISEPINNPDAKALWRHYEIMRPGSRESARLLTLGNSPDNTTFGFAAQRPYGNFAVYNLYNCTENTKPLSLDFKEAGLPQGVKCAVFDFWSNKVIGYATNSYSTAPLAYLSSALLRFTPLVDELPTLIGSTFHLSIGATEIDDVRVSPSSVDVKFNGEAGAQEGSLTFYSKKPLVAAGSVNCSVISIENTGDNLWQVNLAGRQWGKEQTIKLSF